MRVGILRSLWRLGLASGWLLGLASGLAVGGWGCSSDAASPFGAGGAGGAGGGATTGGAGGLGGEDPGAGGSDPTLGGPCADDAGCDDGADCTADRCDGTLGRCRFEPDPTRCDDGIFCDGVEICVPRVGCEPGPPHDCGDGDPCTIDTCEEETRTCTRAPRDADGDGDPDGHCPGGADCDDLDPSRSSASPEVCSNAVDDDCDGDADEPGCLAPPHDDCGDALALEPGAVVVVSTAGSDLDVGTSCAPEGAAFDVIATVTVPDGPPRDIDVRASAQLGPIAVAIAAECGAPASELACGGPAAAPGGTPRARALARSVAPGEATIVLTTSAPESVTLDVRLGPATEAEPNETCEGALALAPGAAIEVDLVDASQDLATACTRTTGELVYRIDLDAPADVDVFAVSLDDLGLPSVSVRGAGCALPEDELTCDAGAVAHVHRGAVDAGPLFIALSATAPTRTSLVVELSPPTPPADDETCEGAPSLALGASQDIDLALHQDDHAPCGPGGADAAYRVELDAPTDLLVVQRLAPGDPGGIALAGETCDAAGLLACAPAGTFPVRLRRRGLAAGSHHLVFEGDSAGSQRVDLLGRPAAPAISVPFADGCDDALLVPPGGGFFVGNTAGAGADLDGGCDDAGGPPGGAPERLLRLELDTPSRVVLDASGSSYRAMLDVRRGPACPGVEVPLACTVTTGSTGMPFLDLDLDQGTHFIQIDGRGGESGAFQLDVFVVPAP